MPKQLKTKLLRGFTLIELLFIIAIVAVMATFGLSRYRESTLNLQAEKVALQMQQILQAGANYYTQNGCWPLWDPRDMIHSGPVCSPDKPSFANKYLPIGLTRTGSSDLYNPFAPISGNASLYRYEYRMMQIGQIFQVSSGKLPNLQFAQHVAALLPSAVALEDSNRWRVDAHIPLPENQERSPFILVGMGKVEVDKNHKIITVNNCRGDSCRVTFTCPTDYWPVVTFSMQNFAVRAKGTPEWLYDTYLIKRIALEAHPQGKCRAYRTVTGTSYTVQCEPYADIKGRGAAATEFTIENVQDGSAYFFYTASCCERETPDCNPHPDYLVDDKGDIIYSD